MTLEDRARRVREHLCDAKKLCADLGLLDGRYGRAWMNQARGVMVLCPWHDERTPSCSVVRGSDGAVTAFCFGCHATGDALGLIAAVHRLDVRRDFAEVLREGAHLAGLHFDEPSPSGWRPRAVPPRPLPPPDPEPLDDETFDAIARVVVEACPLRGEVAQYLNARRLGRLALAAGWAALPDNDQGLDALRGRIVDTVGEEAWLRSGLAVRDGKNRGRWVWRGHRLVIPWADPGGTITTLQRRVVGEAPEGVGKYIFASGRSPRWPYGVDAMGDQATGPVAFVEGAVDVLALRALCAARGIEAEVVGVPGTSAWRDELGATWGGLARGRVAVIGLDMEPGGRAAEGVAKATRAMQRDLGAAGAVRVDEWRPKGGAKDWGEVWAAGRAQPERASA